jgi:hypothetical protein
MSDLTDTSTESRAAILLIHGVGQQKPYQLLDVFARGLIDHYQAKIEKIEPRLFQFGGQGSVRSCVTLHFKEPVGRQQLDSLDLFEFYWAGMVQGRITLRQMLRWALGTSIPPLKLWAQQMTLPGGNAQLGLALFRELATAFGLLLATILIIFPIPYIVVHIQDYIGAGQQIVGVLQTLANNPPGLFGALVLLILVILEIFIIVSILQIGLRLGRGKDMEASMLKQWGIGSIGLFVILLLLIGVIAGLSDPASLAALGEVGAALFTGAIGWGLFSLLLAYGAGRFMVDFVGDIPLYVEADEKSEFHRTRDEIKSAGLALLTNLVDNPEYRAVFVAGHSLGSVIGYDLINQLIRESRAGLPHDLTRLRGMLTFGSPLDKIYYFFRDTVGEKQAVRAQIQSFLHGFRKKSSGRDYHPYRFDHYDMPILETMQWVNVYSAMDIVSDRLNFYAVDEQIHLGYWNPLTAHASYWGDASFYSILAALLEARTSFEGRLSK